MLILHLATDGFVFNSTETANASTVTGLTINVVIQTVARAKISDDDNIDIEDSVLQGLDKVYTDISAAVTQLFDYYAKDLTIYYERGVVEGGLNDKILADTIHPFLNIDSQDSVEPMRDALTRNLIAAGSLRPNLNAPLAIDTLS